MDLKQPDDLLYLVGSFQPIFGGSHYDLVTGQSSAEAVPSLDPVTPRVYQRLHAAIQAGRVRACHDLSEGGLAVAAAEMCIGGRLGLQLDLRPVVTTSVGSAELTTKVVTTRVLYGETTGCLLVEVHPQDEAAFEAHFAGLPFIKLGKVSNIPLLNVKNGLESILSISIDHLFQAWTTPL
jgi:phosphoribosylformylglycinamidine synthase